MLVLYSDLHKASPISRVREGLLKYNAYLLFFLVKACEQDPCDLLFV